MIKAQELRIGNLLEHKGQFVPVLRLDSMNELKDLGYIGSVTVPEYLPGGTEIWNYNSTWLSHCNAIELTPEWLIKLGFDERCSWFHFDVHDDLGLRYEPVEDLLVIYDNDESSIQLKNIKHVHQIQNLFFDLTAAKLELKK